MGRWVRVDCNKKNWEVGGYPPGGTGKINLKVDR